MSALLRIPAGRSVRREGTKFIDAQPQPGNIELERLDDDLLEFKWIDSATGAASEELMLVVGISTFTEVAQDDSRRTYVLDFSGSSDKFFFWLQRADLERELQNVADLNGFMQNSNYTKGMDPIAVPPARPAAASATTAQAGSTGQATAHADTVKLLVEWTQGGVLQPSLTDASLTDFTAKDDVASSLADKPELVQLLPRDLVPSTPDAETLSTALASSQFTGAISSLDEALKSGRLSMDTLKEAGVPEGTGIDYTSFLTALVDMKPSSGGDAMETD